MERPYLEKQGRQDMKNKVDSCLPHAHAHICTHSHMNMYTVCLFIYLNKKWKRKGWEGMQERNVPMKARLPPGCVTLTRDFQLL